MEITLIKLVGVNCSTSGLLNGQARGRPTRNQDAVDQSMIKNLNSSFKLKPEHWEYQLKARCLKDAVIKR